MNNQIIIFYHVYCYDEWEEIVCEQLIRLKTSNVYDACLAMFVRIIGIDSDVIKCKRLMKEFKKIHYIGDSSINDCEVTTLKTIHTFAQEVVPFRTGVDLNVLYFHTKGVYSSRENDLIASRMRDWRHLMEYFVIDKWHECVAHIESGCDVVGVNWRKQNLFGPIVGHFSGNFWWASMKYLYNLPEINESDRAYHEFWIGQNQPNAYCMHESGVDHYHENYPPEKYNREIS